MESKHKLSINQWALEDRPREKMMEKGAAALSDAELLVNVKSYHEKQRQNSWFNSTEDGTILGQKVKHSFYMILS